MSRLSGCKLVVIGFAAFATPSAASAGFFDQLFGSGSQSGSFFGYGAPGVQQGYAPVRRHVYHPKKLVEEKAVLQKPTDIMHDETLHYGDVVMLKNGINIFTGERGYSHDLSDFTPLKEAQHLRPKERLALAEINAVRKGEVGETKSAARLVTGRSSAEGEAPVSDTMIKDRDGKLIRYVGP